jgi:DNA-binding NtrC family response regulator
MPRKNPDATLDEEAPMSLPFEVLVASADVETCVGLTEMLVKNQLIPVCCSTLGEARSMLLQHRICLVLSDYRFPDGDFHDVLIAVEASASRVPVIITSGTINTIEYLDAMSSGAFDCVRYPWAPRELRRIVSHALSVACLFSFEPVATGQESFGGNP